MTVQRFALVVGVVALWGLAALASAQECCCGATESAGAAAAEASDTCETAVDFGLPAWGQEQPAAPCGTVELDMFGLPVVAAGEAQPALCETGAAPCMGAGAAEGAAWDWEALLGAPAASASACGSETGAALETDIFGLPVAPAQECGCP